jgi:hypothetical protein
LNHGIFCWKPSLLGLGFSVLQYHHVFQWISVVVPRHHQHSSPLSHLIEEAESLLSAVVAHEAAYWIQHSSPCAHSPADSKN